MPGSISDSFRPRLRVNLIGGDNPDYAQVLAKYADDSASLEAVQTGRELIKASNADEASAAFGDISPEHMPMAGIGASHEIANGMGENRPVNQDRTPYFARSSPHDKLDLLIDDPTVRAVFEARIGRERDMVRTNRTMQGGSNTAENLADGADLRGYGGTLASLAQGRFGQALAQGLGAMTNAAARGVTGMTEETAQRVGQFLMSADPAEIRTLADLYAKTQAAASQPRIGAAVIAGGANAPRHQQEKRR